MLLNSSRGILFVLSGPSGAGKGTLRECLFQKVSNVVFSISCTTRPPRNGEKNGVDYRFIDKNEFMHLVDSGEFLEWAEVHGYYYGTLSDDVDRELKAGRNVVLEIDVQGARQIKKKRPDSVTIFVKPPSFEELEKRLRNRATESESDLMTRLQNARKEINDSSLFKHIIINDGLKRASEELVSIIKSYNKNITEKEQ